MNSPALYQILYQNDILFRMAGEVVEPVAQAAALPVEEKVTPTVSVAPVTPKIDFPALNHGILILVDEPKHSGLVASEALLLDNILKAVGHASEKTDLLNFSFLPGSDARQVLKEKRTNYFITFGVPLIKLQLDLLLPPYTPKLVEGIWFLLTDPLAVIDADKTLKKKLWLALQKMFEKA